MIDDGLDPTSATTVNRPVDIPGGSPKDRILAAASRLFAERGARAVGVNAVIAEANVAKATFYRHFPSKTDLVIAWLRSPSARWLDEVRAAADGSGDRLHAYFEAVGRWLGADGHRGCPYLLTAAEWRDRPAVVQDVIVEYLAEVETFLEEVVAELGADERPAAARQLRVLTAGAMSLAVAERGADGIHAAGEAARLLMM